MTIIYILNKEAWERCRLGDWEMRGKSLGTSHAGGHGKDPAERKVPVKAWERYLTMEG